MWLMENYSSFTYWYMCDSNTLMEMSMLSSSHSRIGYSMSRSWDESSLGVDKGSLFRSWRRVGQRRGQVHRRVGNSFWQIGFEGINWRRVDNRGWWVKSRLGLDCKLCWKCFFHVSWRLLFSFFTVTFIFSYPNFF